MAKLSGTIFNIQRFSTEDGPGIRTTVFFKGCPLRCLWCSNPESQSPIKQVAHRDSLCNGCESCKKVCSMEAISLRPSNGSFIIKIDRNKCNNCGRCIEACKAGALQFYGQSITVDELFTEVKKDIGYYFKSQGGITASGGEPLEQINFVAELFQKCRNIGIHTTLDTCGYSAPSALDKILDKVDLVLFDIKLMNRQQHKQLTGKYNDVILQNAHLIANKGIQMIIRIPLIPNFNDSEDNLNEIAYFISQLDNTPPVVLLPYHRLGVNKYKMLDIDYQLMDVMPPDEKHIYRCQEIIKRYGLRVSI